jgi:predicted nucleic acid-binding protein
MLRMEVMNALQRLVFESRTGNQPLRVTPEAALVAAGVFDDQLAIGIVLRRVKLDDAALERQFDALCLRHTAKLGFRTYDLLHVSAALVLGCDTFWSFDFRARKLAKLEGLGTN